MHSVDAYPAEGGLLIVGLIGFLDQTNALKHICNVVEPSNLGLELLGFFVVQLLVDLDVEEFVHADQAVFTEGDLAGGFLERNHVAPGHKEPNELLAQYAE